MLSDADDYNSEPSYENTAPMMRANNPIAKEMIINEEDDLSF